jgi:hypothetical protein
VLFYDQKETIQYLFISCPLAKIIWRIVCMAFNIIPPTNITNPVGNWLVGFQRMKKYPELECVLYYGPYGILGIIIFISLTMQDLFLSCMLSHWLRSRSFVVLRTTNGKIRRFGY